MAPAFPLFQNLVHFGRSAAGKLGQQGSKIAYLPRKVYQKLKYCIGKLFQTGNLMVASIFTLP